MKMRKASNLRRSRSDSTTAINFEHEIAPMAFDVKAGDTRPTHKPSQDSIGMAVNKSYGSSMGIHSKDNR